MTFTKPARLLAVLLLAVAAASVNATTITYSFSGSSGFQGIYSESSSWTLSPDGGSWNRIDDYSSPPDNSVSGSGTLNFTVDASRYIDQDAATGQSSSSSTNSTLPWLSSSAFYNGPTFSSALNTHGGISSELFAYSHFFSLVDYAYLSEQTTYDALGRLESNHRIQIYNRIQVNGEVVLGLIDGVELPTAFGTLFPKGTQLEQISFDSFDRYSYDAAGSPTLTMDYTTNIAQAIIENITIARSDDPINIPEPGSLALVAVALLGLGARRKIRN